MVTTEQMAKTKADEAFAFATKKEALGPYIEAKWGWDEAYQLEVHAQRWATKSWYRILQDGEAVGTVAIDPASDHIRLGEFYIRPIYQWRGVGTLVLTSVVQEARRKGVPVRLECLKWNPAVSFYARNGFVTTHENESHYFMEKAPR